MGRAAIRAFRSRVFPLLLAVAGFGTSVTAQELRFQLPASAQPLADALVAASLSAQTLRAGPAPAQDILAAAQADYARLLAALYEAGHYGGTISIKIDGREAAEISPLASPEEIAQLVIRIAPGPRFRFGRVSAGPLARNFDLPESFRPGAPAEVTVIREVAQAATDAWRDDGYAKARLDNQQITARHADAELDVALRIAPGSRLRFGNLIVPQDSAVSPRRLRQIAGLPQGQFFDPAELERVNERLRRSGAFRASSLSEAETPRGDLLDIGLQVTDAPPRRFGFGAEISSLEGLDLSGFWLHRNLFGGAERLRFDASISGLGGDTGEDYRLSGRFERPATFNHDTDFFAEAGIAALDELEFSSDSVTLGAGITRYARPERTYSAGLRYRRARVEDDFGIRNFSILSFPLGLEFDYRDDPLNPRKGYFAKLDVEPFTGLSGTDDGSLTRFDLRGYYTPGGDNGRLTLALRGQLGALQGPAIDMAPADFLFFSGGGGTVRGQPFQSLGITLPSGERTGGRAFLGLSSEARFGVNDSFELVGFFDAGYIGPESFPDGSSGLWHSGAGIGIRYNTGIGPIRVDLGLPVTDPEDTGGLELYIGIGQAF